MEGHAQPRGPNPKSHCFGLQNTGDSRVGKWRWAPLRSVWEMCLRTAVKRVMYEFHPSPPPRLSGSGRWPFVTRGGGRKKLTRETYSVARLGRPARYRVDLLPRPIRFLIITMGPVGFSTWAEGRVGAQPSLPVRSRGPQERERESPPRRGESPECEWGDGETIWDSMKHWQP